ncbi:hypothetical protein LPJ59_005294, partial [Coemansia sp. RSA 2399]
QADSNSASKEQVDDDDNNELCDDQNDDDELLGIEPASTTSECGSKGKDKGKGKKKGKKQEFPYIHQLKKEVLDAMGSNVVFIDPGRRDLLYCLHESSSAEAPSTFRYTRNMKDQVTRYSRFKKIREQAKNHFPGNEINKAEQSLGTFWSGTTRVDTFAGFLLAQSRVWHILSYFYTNTVTDSLVNPKPLHRQLHLASYLNGRHADNLLCDALHKKFGENPVLVMGNWSAPMAKFHEPIKGLGMRRMLRQHGFRQIHGEQFHKQLHQIRGRRFHR